MDSRVRGNDGCVCENDSCVCENDSCAIYVIPANAGIHLDLLPVNYSNFIIGERVKFHLCDHKSE